MGDEHKKPNPHEAEQKDVAAQAGAINMVSRVSEMLPFCGNLRLLSRTDFEGHALNDMIDMVESANPEHLETAGTALWDARDAIRAAADELKDHVGNVDWEGESGTAFREWGDKLVKHATALSDFAEVAGTQIKTAATGLASVRSSMPPRDNRLVPKKVVDIPTPEQVPGNKDYAAAVKAEEDRQEAINQMNRLASFYSVSEETLAAQEPPVFEAMPSVGVPKPAAKYKELPSEGNAQHGLASSVHASASRDVGSDSVDSVAERPQAHHTVPSADRPQEALPDRHVGTQIDSVGTMTPQETVKSPVNMPTTATGGSVPPFLGGGPPPAFGVATGRTSNFGGTPVNRAPVSPQGRAGAPGGTTGARGNGGPLGRAAGTGQAPGGRSGGTAAGRQLTGRGVTGGTPRPATGSSNGRTGGIGSTGAARGNGVVGGRPSAGGPSGSTASRVPRGTVVGSEGTKGSRTPKGRIGQRGVIGAPESKPGSAARPTTGNADGVVGKPTGRTPANRNGNPPRRDTNREGPDEERRRKTRTRDERPTTEDERGSTEA